MWWTGHMSFFPSVKMHFRLDESLLKLHVGMEHSLKDKKNKIRSLGLLLEGLGPKNVLARGFSYMKDSKGRVVTHYAAFKKMPSGESLAVTFKDGEGRVRKI